MTVTSKMILLNSLVLISSSLFATRYKVVWSFGGAPNDGAISLSSLVVDGSGNLYGTTEWGGASTAPGCDGAGCGTVFKLSPNLDGTWSNTILYNFCTNPVNNLCLDGQAPLAGLIFDQAGNLYGTTFGGGPQTCSDGYTGCGVVFELLPPPLPGGNWTEKVLYNFCSNLVNNTCLDGFGPVSQLTFDAGGNIFGTTPYGGTGHYESGVVFELSPGLTGWTETVLYNFCSLGQGEFCLDGAYPVAGVTFDQFGNLFGTTARSGWTKAGGGTVFKLSQSAGGWTHTIIHDFADTRNQVPLGPVVFDSFGVLYCTTSAGFPYGWGGILRMSPDGTVRSFSFDGTNGSQPLSSVLVDPKTGSLYGTTKDVLFFSGNANVYKIGPKGEETVLHNFCSRANCEDGDGSYAALVQDHVGNLYGTTKGGGALNLGVIFEIVP